MKIAVLVGSLQEKSFNKTLTNNLEKGIGDRATFEYVDISMPLFNEDLESDVPEIVEKAKAVVAESDGVLIVTPEYNRSIPGVLKNAIDWLSRPYGSQLFVGKPVAMAGASPSPVGTAVAQSDLRHSMAYLGAKIMSQPELYLASAHLAFDEEGNPNEEVASLLEGYVTTLVAWVENEG